MLTWILGSTIGTAVVARDSLDQLLQTALVAHLLALVGGGHVYSLGVNLFTQAVGRNTGAVGGRRGSGVDSKAGSFRVVYWTRSMKQHWDNWSN